MGFSLAHFFDPLGVTFGKGKGGGGSNFLDPGNITNKPDAGSSTTTTAANDGSNGRNLGNELTGLLGQLPAFAAGQNAYLNSTLFGTDGNSGLLASLQKLGPALDQLNAGSATTQRLADLNDATSMAGGYNTLKQQLNPQLYGILSQLQSPSALETAAGNYAQQNLGPTDGENYLSGLTAQLSQPDSIENSLYDQATKMLGTDGNLTAQDLYNIQQDTRSAYAGRGMYDSNSALGAEILNQDSARRQRQLDNANFASTVDQLRTGRINNAGNLASSLASATNARTSSGLNGLLSAANLTQSRLGGAAGVASQLQTDPYAVIGRAPANTQTDTGILGQTPDYLSGLLGYSSDLYNTNYNANSAANIAAGNNSAAKSAGNTAAIASIGGAALTALAIF